jgi:hypothetical protein
MLGDLPLGEAYRFDDLLLVSGPLQQQFDYVQARGVTEGPEQLGHQLLVGEGNRL